MPVAEESVPHIRIRAHGPMLVTGDVALSRIANDQQAGAAGEWGPRRPLDTGDRADFVLCRCGHSADKPFCDTSHRDAEVDLGVAPPEGDRADRVRTYGDDDFAVADDRPVCSHASFCATATTNVWKMAPRADSAEVRAEVATMVHRCPSGALDVLVDGQVVPADVEVEIVVVDDGPVHVRGGIEVELPDGTLLETRDRVTLCRCGRSSIKPLCDGSHAETGFRDDGRH